MFWLLVLVEVGYWLTTACSLAEDEQACKHFYRPSWRLGANLAITVSRFSRISWMRDLITAAHERTIVYDGGMGATLEQFELSLENDYRLPGRCHEALILQPAGRDRGRPRLHARSRRDVLETDTFQASRLKLAEWGSRGSYARDQPQGPPRSPARPQASSGSWRGSIGPTGFLPASDDPTLGKITFRRAGRRVRRAGGRPAGRGCGSGDHRDRSGTSSRSKPQCSVSAAAGAEARPRGADPVQRVRPCRQGPARCCSTDIQRRAGGHSRRWMSI